jgi:hypothetical protein
MAARDSDTTLRLFCQLSSVLTGEVAVASATAKRHLKTLQDALGADQVAQVIRRFRDLEKSGGDIVQGVKDQLFGDPSLNPLVKKIVLLWFTGQVGVTLASQDDYYEALMWAAVGAHPPALSDAYFGHWRYPPDVGS